MKSRFAVLFLCLVLAVVVTSLVAGQEKIELRFLYLTQAGYQPSVIEAGIKEFESSHPEIAVKPTFVPYDSQYLKIRDSAMAKTASFDVITMDLIWTAEFAQKGYIEPLSEELYGSIHKNIRRSILGAFEYNEKCWGMPFLANFQLLFYNQDYLEKAGFKEPPSTLEDLELVMKAMKQKGIIKYPFMDSWNRREGLICDYVLFSGAYGGSIFDRTGAAVFNKGAGLKALKTMVRWIDEGLVNPEAVHPSGLVTDERLARDMFIQGKCAFSTNWTFVNSYMNDSRYSRIVGKGKIGIIPVSKEIYRKGQPNATSVSGFQALAVSSNSPHKDEAWKFVEYISDPEFIGKHLEEMPVWTSLQESPETRAKNPNIGIESIQIASVYNRPMVPNYTWVSQILQNYLVLALDKQMTPEAALDQAAKEINDLK